RRRHTRSKRDWSSDVCSSDLGGQYFLKWLINRSVRVELDSNALLLVMFHHHKRKHTAIIYQFGFSTRNFLRTGIAMRKRTSAGNIDGGKGEGVDGGEFFIEKQYAKFPRGWPVAIRWQQ